MHYCRKQIENAKSGNRRNCGDIVFIFEWKFLLLRLLKNFKSVKWWTFYDLSYEFKAFDKGYFTSGQKSPPGNFENFLGAIFPPIFCQ